VEPISPLDPGSARISFRGRDYDLADIARTTRYIDYVWADSIQVLLAVSGTNRIPARPILPRPPVLQMHMSSPMWLDVAVGGAASTAFWFFRFAVKNPEEIGDWWPRVKLGRERARRDLERLKGEPIALPPASADPVSTALQLGVQAEARLFDLRRELQGDESDEEGKLSGGVELRASPPLAHYDLVPSVAEHNDLARAVRVVRAPIETDEDAVVRRLEQDARRLRHIAGEPDIEMGPQV
jgi:hypothetical protein